MPATQQLLATQLLPATQHLPATQQQAATTQIVPHLHSQSQQQQQEPEQGQGLCSEQLQRIAQDRRRAEERTRERQFAVGSDGQDQSGQAIQNQAATHVDQQPPQHSETLACLFCRESLNNGKDVLTLECGHPYRSECIQGLR